MRAAIPMFMVLAACSGGGGTEAEDAEPTLAITSPQRGAFTDTTTVTVAGTVSDDHEGVRVTVNGADVTVNADGSFSTTVTVEPGMAFLETHAIDSRGQDVRDVRAAIAGDVAPSNGSVKAALGARLAPAGLTTVGGAIGTAAEAIDFTAAAKAMNPVYNNDGCLGAKVDITSITLSNIDVALTAKAGALDTNVAVSNLTVKLHADFKVACIGGSTNITAHATTAHVRDDMTLAIAAGKIKTAVPSPTVTLDGFTVDVGGVPSQIESLLRDKAREAAETRIQTIIKDRVPAIADGALAGLVAKPVSANLVGKPATITVTPSKIELASTGMFVAVNTSIVVQGGESGTYAANPMPIAATLVDRANTLGVAVADDMVNQLMAGLWAAGAFDPSITNPQQLSLLSGILGTDIAALDVQMSLPPTMKTAGTGLELAVGDLIVTAKDAAGTAVLTAALSLTTTMVAGPSSDGKRIVLTTTTPTVKVQILSQAVENPIEASELEGIVTGVWGVVGGMADDALGKLPMPQVAGIQLTAPTVMGKAGYVVLDVGAH
jgi:hypothetical protein